MSLKPFTSTKWTVVKGICTFNKYKVRRNLTYTYLHYRGTLQVQHWPPVRLKRPQTAKWHPSEQKKTGLTLNSPLAHVLSVGDCPSCPCSVCLSQFGSVCRVLELGFEHMEGIHLHALISSDFRPDHSSAAVGKGRLSNTPKNEDSETAPNAISSKLALLNWKTLLWNYKLLSIYD